MSRPLKITEIPYHKMEVELKRGFRDYLTTEDAPTYRDKHLVDCTSEQEPAYDDEWWRHQDNHTRGGF